MLLLCNMQAPPPYSLVLISNCCPFTYYTVRPPLLGPSLKHPGHRHLSQQLLPGRIKSVIPLSPLWVLCAEEGPRMSLSIDMKDKRFKTKAKTKALRWCGWEEGEKCETHEGFHNHPESFACAQSQHVRPIFVQFWVKEPGPGPSLPGFLGL